MIPLCRDVHYGDCVDGFDPILTNRSDLGPHIQGVTKVRQRSQERVDFIRHRSDG